MKIIFIGPQGSGKGTQAKIISEELKISHISTGDLFRALDGKLKEEVDDFIDLSEDKAKFLIQDRRYFKK